jgi:hypothetical protein
VLLALLALFSSLVLFARFVSLGSVRRARGRVGLAASNPSRSCNIGGRRVAMMVVTVALDQTSGLSAFERSYVAEAVVVVWVVRGRGLARSRSSCRSVLARVFEATSHDSSHLGSICGRRMAMGVVTVRLDQTRRHSAFESSLVAEVVMVRVVRGGGLGGSSCRRRVLALELQRSTGDGGQENGSEDEREGLHGDDFLWVYGCGERQVRWRT